MKTEIIKDLPNKKMSIKRKFDASLADVWKAWTESDLLDQWWVPLPCKAKTKSFDFREGGSWLYEVLDPDATERWVIVEFSAIKRNKSFEAISSFCDRDGVIDHELPVMHWKNQFIHAGMTTEVAIEISFTKDVDIERIIAWGFERGFTAAAENLDKVFANSNSRVYE